MLLFQRKDQSSEKSCIEVPHLLQPKKEGFKEDRRECIVISYDEITCQTTKLMLFFIVQAFMLYNLQNQ